ncbi:hypothetical protein HAYMO_132 [Serratia phage vB_SmaM_Haymo]|nr:hypothetical protein HAYMO_132 [Serratia phage vB_SmaM_Haymo]
MFDKTKLHPKPIHRGTNNFYQHWRYGIPHHTRTGVKINNGDVIDGVEFRVTINDDGSYSSAGPIIDGMVHGECCPVVEDAFVVTTYKYSHDTDLSLERTVDLLQYSKRTIIVGYSSEITKLKSMLSPEQLKLATFHVIHDMCTVDDFRRAVKRACNNPGKHPMVFLGCLQEAVGAAMAGISNIENEHYIFIW